MHLRLYSLILAFSAFFVSAGLAQESKEGKAHVVVVGISKYKDPQIKERPNAENDAIALFNIFADPKYLGLTKENGTLLLGKPEKAKIDGHQAIEATRENILNALKNIASKANPEDLVIFTFIGEGGPLGDSGDRRCYFTSDSTFQDRDKNALASSDISDVLKNLKSNKFCTFLDIDFKGFQSKGKSVAEATLGTNPY
ncbi:MAG: hypothetical protein RL595_794, partial [Planctomycetota bacterium]